MKSEIIAIVLIASFLVICGGGAIILSNYIHSLPLEGCKNTQELGINTSLVHWHSSVYNGNITSVGYCYDDNTNWEQIDGNWWYPFKESIVIVAEPAFDLQIANETQGYILPKV